MGIAVGLATIAFGAGYALRARRDARVVADAGVRPKAAAPRIVRRTDTVRIVRNDTVIVARFVFGDDAARSVALVGDFNKWDASANPLARVGTGGWASTLRLKPGRYQYAFVVDVKHWVADRFARATHDQFDIPTSDLVAGSAATTTSDGNSAATRLKKVLPRASAEHVIATIASARAKGLPASALENHALKYAAKHVAPKDIERAIRAESERMSKAGELLVAADRRDPSGAEIEAGAELLGHDADTAAVGTLARSAPANRQLDVPLRVSAELIADNVTPHDALARVQDRLRSGATDAQLEHLLDESTARLASQSKGKGKESRVAKGSSAAGVRQAGAPAKTHATKPPRHKASDK
jgi:hypothetical protein